VGVIVRLALLAGLTAGPVSATSYQISVDTSSVIGTYGYIDLEFNPGNATTQAATANILNFEPDGAVLDNTNIQTSGDFIGTLPGPLTAVNDTPYNDYFEGLTFGSVLSFVLTLSGPAIASPNGTSTAGTTFGVGFYDINQNSILTDDPSGFAGEVNINLDGTTAPIVFPNASGGPSVVTIQQVPEPSMFWLVAGIIGVLLLRFMGSQIPQGNSCDS
jgi:hypothetical protein